MLSFEVPAYRIAPGPDSHPGDSAWTPLHRARRVLRQPLERVLEDHGDWNSRSASGLRGTRSNAQRPRYRRPGAWLAIQMRADRDTCNTGRGSCGKAAP